MADFTIDGELKLEALNALRVVEGVGKKLDDVIGKGNTVVLDTKKAEADIKKLGAEADKTLSEVGKGDGGGLFSGLSESLAGLVSPAGLATAGIGALTAGLAASFQVGAEFQKNLAAVSAITGITGGALDDIGVRAQDLAAKFGGTATTQLESFQGVLSRFGAQLADTPDDLGAVSESINILAKAGGIDAASAMDTLTTAMLQFGVDTGNSSELAAESARFINVMAASARVGAAEIPQVGEAVKVAGVAMKGAKVSFEEGNAAIQVLAAGGKVGAEAGTALRNVLGKIAGEEVIPKEAAAKLKSLGVNMKVVSDTTLPFATRLQELNKASKDATAFAQVFGSENAGAATILAQGAGTVASWTKEITGTKDATTQAAVNMGTLSEQLGRAKTAFENTLINVNKVLSPILAEVFGTITQVFGKVKDALAPVFSSLTKTLGTVFEKIKPVFTAIIGFLGGAWLVQLTTIFAAVGTAVDVVLNVFVKLFDGIVEAVSPVVDALKKAFGFSDDANKSIDVMQIFGEVLSTITDAISFFGEILTEVGGFLVEVFLTPLKIIIAVITEIVEYFTPANKAIEDTGKAAESSGGFFSKFIDIVKQAPEFIKAVTAGFKAFVGSITDLISNFSFDKLGKILKGETFGAAFGKSMGDSASKAANETLLEGFENSAKRLQALAEKVNLSKSEQDRRFNLASQELQSQFNKVDFERENELLLAKSAAQKKAINDKYDKQKDAVLKEYKLSKTKIEEELKQQKEADKVKFQGEKERIANQINAKEKAGEIDAKKAQELRAQILDINLAADKKEEAATKKADTAKKEKAKKEKDDSFKLWLENRKLLDDAEVKRIADDTERDIRASQLKEEREIETVLNTIKEVKAADNKNAAEKKFEIDLLEKQITAIMVSEQANRESILRKAQKDLDKERLKEEEANAKELASFEKKQKEDFLKFQAANAKERLQVEEAYAKSHVDIFTQLQGTTTDIFGGISQAIADAFKPDTSAAKEATDAARKEAETQLADLKKSLKDKTIAFADYQDKVAEINAKLAESGEVAGKSFGQSLVDGLNSSLGVISGAIKKIGDGMVAQFYGDRKELAQINKDLEDERTAQTKAGADADVETVRERKNKIAKLELQQAALQRNTMSDTQAIISTLAFAVSSSITSAAAAGSNIWESFVLGTLDAVNALVPLFTVMILGKELSELGLFGLIGAAGLIGVMTAALAAAKAAVQENGFYYGGYTGKGADNTVKGVVHEEEYVISKKGVKGEVSAFDELHNTLKNGVSMTTIMEAYKERELSGLSVNSAGVLQRIEVIQPIAIPVMNNYDVVSEVRSQTFELSRKLDAVIESTDRMPTAFRGNVKHDFEFHHDPSISIKKAAYDARRKALQ